jgi:hypothetical protein
MPMDHLRGKSSIRSRSIFHLSTEIMESAVSDDEVVGVGDYEGAAAGWGALKAVAGAVRGQMAIVKETRGLLSMNQPHGFDCPGCAWPDPKTYLIVRVLRERR